jgi:hypothetical protein
VARNPVHFHNPIKVGANLVFARSCWPVGMVLFLKIDGIIFIVFPMRRVIHDIAAKNF